MKLQINILKHFFFFFENYEFYINIFLIKYSSDEVSFLLSIMFPT